MFGNGSEEDEVRKKLRAEELATRASRQIYVLRQQVRQIQQELTKSGTDKTKHTKKVCKKSFDLFSLIVVAMFVNRSGRNEQS
jgi:ATP-dependent Lon protease